MPTGSEKPTGDVFGDVVASKSGGSTKSDVKVDGGYDAKELAAAAAQLRGKLTAPGQLPLDTAKEYFARVANLFPGVGRTVVDLGLFSWGALNGTGTETNYGEAPNIDIGGHSVPAVKVFGEIFPVDRRGIPRKAFSAYFESNAVQLIEALPELAAKLSARAARAGQHNASPMLLVDFVKGVTHATIGDGVTRQRVKDTLLARRNKGEYPRSAGVTTPVVELGRGDANHGLF